MKLSRGIGLLAVLLVVSVGVNLFLAGNQLGQKLRHPPPMNFEQRLEALLQNLPNPDRKIADEILEKHRQELVTKLRQYRASAQAAATAIRAEPFNAEEARTAFAKANEHSAEFRQAVQDMVIEVAAKISPEGREYLRPGVGGP